MNTARFQGLGILLFIALLLSACGATGGALQPNGTPTGSGPAEFTVQNSSSESIHYIYMSAASQDSWGPDQLGEGVTLNAGQNFTVRNIPAGVYDIRVEDASRNSKEWRGETLDAGGKYTLDVGSDGWTGN